MLLFEWGIRTISKVDTSGFTGPTIAAAALSLLIPLTEPISKEPPRSDGLKVINTKQQIFIPIIFISSFIYLFLWGWTCYLSITSNTDKILDIDFHLIVGLSMYVYSSVMVYIRDYL